ncbi:MAG: T9SS type A sorting domain-containing protein [Flavobacterium sp.]|nr:MAG: T9SS type A sorting domain-containing protein [Flavobacterium sp.]
MNYKIIFAMLLITTFCNAQIVTITDVNFKNALLTSSCVDADLNGSYESNADLNNDGEIQVSEALAIKRLKISGKSIADLTGIESFVNLKRLLCSNNLLTTVDFSSNINLELIDLYSNNFVSLTIDGLPLLNTLNLLPNPNLQNLTVTNNSSLAALTIHQSFSSLSSLVQLNCSNNALTALTFNYNSLPNLTSINCSNNQLTYFSLNASLQHLNISNNLLTSFNLYHSNITSLDISNNQLTTLSLYNCHNLNSINYLGNPNLTSLSIINTSITSLSVHDLGSLEYLDCGFDGSSDGNKLTSLALYNLPSLQNFSAYNNEITTLDLSNLPSLQTFDVSENPNIDLTLSNLPFITEYESGNGNSIKISNMPNLSTLNFGAGNIFNSISIENNPQLDTIYFSQWKVDEFEVINCPNLTNFDFTCTLEQNTSYNLNLESLPNLATVSLSINDFCNLNLNDLPALNSISLSGMSSFTIQNLPQLQTLFAGSVTNFTLANLPLLQELTVASSLTSLNLSNLPSLYTINAGGNPITNVSLVNLPLLHDLNLEYCYTEQTNNSYTFENLPNLYSLNLKNTSVSNVSLNNLPNLHDFKLSNNVNMNALNFNDLPGLYDVQISQCYNLSTITFDNLNALHQIYLYSTGLEELDLIDLPNLYDVTLDGNTEIVNNGLHFSELPSLYKLNLTFNQLTSLNFNSPLPALVELDISHNSLFSTNLSNLPALGVLDISGNGLFLTSLDLSSNPNITHIDYSSGWYNDQLKYINLRNGNNNLVSLNVGNSVTKICVDDLAEKAHLLSLDSSLANTVFTTYCSFDPAGTFYTLQGNCILDSNNNGCDDNDVLFPMVNLNIENNEAFNMYFANNSGNYEIPLIEGQYTITPSFENSSYYTFSPSTINVSFPMEDTNSLVQNFCVVPNGNHNDLEINILPLTQARPGFDATYKLVYKNKGNQAQSGTINLNFNDSVLDFVSTNQVLTTQSTNLLNWSFVDLKPFESRSINIVFNVNSPIETPPVVSNDVLQYTAEIIGLEDENSNDNLAVLNQTVVNSFDPNDKTCLEGKMVATTLIGEFVHYMVRFENTGTASAINIVVKDMIDLEKFDLSSLIPLYSSHVFYTRTTSSGQVEFIFENINLSHLAPNDKGYIAFKIKTKETLVANDTFSNQANIYFDYNNPIITNNYITTIQQPLSINDIKFDDKILIYPNPVMDVLYFKTNQKIVKAQVFDINGRILSSNTVTDQKLDVSQLQSGSYLLKLYTEKESSIAKIIKQ